MNQVNINFEETYIPIIISSEGEKYYPLRYIFEKILEKSKGVLYNKNYQKLLVKFDIQYKNNIQESKCVSEDNLILIIKNSGNFNKTPFGKIEKYKTFVNILESERKFSLIKTLDKRKRELISNELGEIRDIFGKKIYNLYKSGDVILIYNHYYQNKDKMRFPRIIRDKECLLEIIKHKYSEGGFTKDEVVLTDLVKKYSLLDCILTSDEVYSYLFGKDFKYYPWRYKKYCNYGLTKSEAKIIFNNYLKEIKIDICDKEKLCDISWYDFLRESKLERFVISNYNDRYTFVLECLDYSIPIYKFKSTGSKHWENRDNRARAIRQLINELNIDEDKIPMYITNNIIQKQNGIMYRILTDYYDGNIYKFIDEAYRGKFSEEDFYVTNLKNKFDSIEESLVDRKLRECFDIVIYNQRYTENTIKIKNMIPDWFVAVDGEIYIVEYFGLYIPAQKSSSRVSEYIQRTDEKIKRYETVENYKKIYIYPQDLKGAFKGFYEKMQKVIGIKKST